MATIKSTEEKAKAYDEAIKKAEVLYKTAEPMSGCNVLLETVFPELKESEDERIRKAIKKALQVRCDGSRIISDEPVTLEEAIAWLEKQGNINPTEDELEALRMAAYEPTKNWSEKLQSLYMKLSHCEQGEQKPADKVEPKFKTGDWISGYYTNYKVLSVNNDGYVVEDVDGNKINILFENEKFHQLWTIQDAKDGDVLYTSSTASNEVFIFKGLTIEGYIECYCSYDSEDKYREGKYHFIGKPTFMTHPATKEQRDLLSQKMKEAGYEWDAEKKELMNL